MGHSELLLLTTHRREMSLALCMLHHLHSAVSWPVGYSAFTSNSNALRNPRSSSWAEPLQKFPGKQCKAFLPIRCLCLGCSWSCSPQQVSAGPALGRALACLCSFSLMSPGLPKTLSTELLQLRTTPCLVPIAAVLLFVKLKLYKKEGPVGTKAPKHCFFFLFFWCKQKYV